MKPISQKLSLHRIGTQQLIDEFSIACLQNCNEMYFLSLLRILELKGYLKFNFNSRNIQSLRNTIESEH